MRQIRLDITQEFERDLHRFMRLRGITNESEAIGQAVRDALAKPGARYTLISDPGWDSG